MHKFYQGFVVEVTGSTFEQVAFTCKETGAIVKVIEDLNIVPVEMAVSTEMIVPVKDLEDVATEAFELGDTVMSTFTIAHPFEGIVVGFELDTNRVICRSARIENYADRRVRYAYRVDEIKKADAGYVEFELDKKYKINCKDDVHVRFLHKDDVVLYTTAGDYYAKVPKRCFRPILATHHKIYQIQECPR